ncbi:Copia protein [Symbiodinium microadriaticum]|uniref:Copia protein n=1 Tax=Symbiodinium microadriaticum TaxID=2951 RepID=A0A1Q9EZ87_SYMMI|nr:Copia protein [Symbiodinium microadriaticum]
MAQASAAEVPPVPEDDEGLDEEEAEEPDRDEQQEYEEFRRWLRLRDRQGGWSERRQRPPRRREDEDDDDGGNDFRTNAGPPPAWDGSQCPFEDYLIRTRLWISTTKAKARTRGPLLLALSDTPFQDFKHLAKDPAWLSNPDNAEALLKKMDSPEYYGDDQDKHLLASLARITYHLKSQKSETARQFLGRWEAAGRKVQEHKVVLPSLYRGFLMINALGLSAAEIKVLLTFTHGSIEPKDIKTWLRKHETKLQAGQLGNEVASKNKATAAVHVIEQEENEENPEDEELGAMEAMLADLAEENPTANEPGYFEEDEAAEILAMMIKEKRKTYAQSAQIKKDKELGRGYRQGAGSANYRDRTGPIRRGTYKLSIAELKQRTRCKRCNKFGHWHRECPNPPAAGSSRDHQKETHLLEIDLEPYEDALFCHYFEADEHQGPHRKTECEPDILSRSDGPKGYGKGQHGEFEVLNLGAGRPEPPERDLRLLAAGDPAGGHLPRLTVSMFKNSVEASFQHVKTHLEGIAPESLRELRDDVNRVLNKRQTDDFDMYMQFREWKKNKKGPASSKDGSFEMIKEEDSESGCTLDSRFTHFNQRTGSRGRRLTTPSPGRPPRGPPPPQPVTTRLPTKTQSSSRMSTSSANSSKATTNKMMEIDHEKLRYESNALVTDKKAQQEIFTSAFHILDPNTPTCDCRRGCKMELSATTQNPKSVLQLRQLGAAEPVQSVSMGSRTATSGRGVHGDESEGGERRREMTSGNETEHFDEKEYEAFVQWKRGTFDMLQLEYGSSGDDRVDRPPLSFTRHQQIWRCHAVIANSSWLTKEECLVRCHSFDDMLLEVRREFATECDVPWQQVHLHDVGEMKRDSQERSNRYARLLDVNPLEIEVMFSRRVRQRRAEDQGGHEDRELRHDSPEGGGREGEGGEANLDGPNQIGPDEERELPHDSAEGDGREGPPGDALEHRPVEQNVPGAGVGLDERDLPGSRTRTLPQLVKRAHDGLGHPHRERFLRILKAAKANEEVLQEARNLKCSVCEKFASVRPPRKAAPPREFGINEVIGMDTVWLPTVGQEQKRVALNIIDYSSHFQMMIPLRGRSPEAEWVKFFGPPRQIWADQGSEFKGAFKVRTAQEGTRMDPSSLEAPTQRGLAERHGKTFKVMLEKTMADYCCESYNEWGQDDAEAGRRPRLGDAGIMRAMEMRKAAAKDYVTGQMVYFYRLGHSEKGDRPHQRWHGPARVIMTDYPGTIWLSYLGGLVKAAPERIRPGSEEENLTISGWLDVLTKAKEAFEKEPTRGYIDLSDEPLPDLEEMDDEPDHGEEGVAQPEPVLRRVRGKRMPERALPEPMRDEQDDVIMPQDDEECVPEPPAKRTRVQILEAYYAKLETLFKTRQRKEVKLKELNQKDLQCFLKATEKEIQNKLNTQAYEKLTAEESERVRRTRPDRIIESRYVRTVKPLELCDVDKANMEGTLLSSNHGGPCKAKVRHVMKGFSEEGAEDLDSATPQVTREGVMLTTQVIVSKGWKMGFLDFTQAFHSGDPISRELYAEQPPEGLPGMQKGELLKLLKTCFGLLDGPMARFRHLRKVLLEELGYVQSLADPCINFLQDESKHGWDRLLGIVSVATDDLLHGGGPEHQERMETLNQKYKLGKFQYGSGRFTGKQFTPQPDGSILIDQAHYVHEKVQGIVLSKPRKAQRYSKCSEEEIAQLRSLVGALSWLAKETRPDLSGRVSLLQQQFPKPRVRVCDILSANNWPLRLRQGGAEREQDLESGKLGLARGETCKDPDWEGALTKFPYLAVTDSKSLYDAVSKQTCEYSQIDDKRTAIDISIVKHELSKGGTVRWIPSAMD